MRMAALVDAAAIAIAIQRGASKRLKQRRTARAVYDIVPTRNRQLAPVPRRSSNIRQWLRVQYPPNYSRPLICQINLPRRFHVATSYTSR